MRKILITSILLLSVNSYADAGQKISRTQLNIPKFVKIAIIDTGLDPLLMDKPFVCKTGHKDFTGSGIVDNHGHGTHISGLIDQYAKNVIVSKEKDSEKLDSTPAQYCQIIIKFIDPKDKTTDSLENMIKAIHWAINQQVDIINISGGGTEFSQREREAIVKALNRGIKIVAAAGNESKNIDKSKYYPAMYDQRIFIVGNLVRDIVRKPSATRDDDVAIKSNWGLSINTWEHGERRLSRIPGNRWGYMSGTSQACAVKSGKLIRQMLSSI